MKYQTQNNTKYQNQSNTKPPNQGNTKSLNQGNAKSPNLFYSNKTNYSNHMQTWVNFLSIINRKKPYQRFDYKSILFINNLKSLSLNNNSYSTNSIIITTIFRPGINFYWKKRLSVKFKNRKDPKKSIKSNNFFIKGPTKSTVINLPILINLPLEFLYYFFFTY